MKQIIAILLTAALLSACGAKEDKATQIAKLKKERSEIDIKLRQLEAVGPKDSVKSIPVAVTEVQPQSFQAFIDVQASIAGDEDVLATAQAAGTVRQVLVREGQRVNRGQTLVILDAAAIDQQVAAQDVRITLLRSLYDKQQKLWAQNIGTEVQLISAKAEYDASLKQRSALVAQRNMYRITAPIAGTVDGVDLKEGDMAAPGMRGVRIVNSNKLKAEAKLGESYLGKVRIGDPVTLIFPDLNDSMKTRITFVSNAVDPISRSFEVQVNLGSYAKLHPNMSARMKIANYSSGNALVVPVAAIQKTGEGDMVFVAEGKIAKAVPIQTGRNSNGMVEVLGGLKAGDRVVTAGYEELYNGTAILVQ